MYKLLLIIAFFIAKGSAYDCIPRHYDSDSIVCVCNATYCDSTPDQNPAVPEEGTFHWYMSTKAGDRMRLKKGHFNPPGPSDFNCTVDDRRKYQKIHGFGGAFTDSAAINIMSLSPGARDQLMRSYFGESGSRYSLGRVPVAGTDFSTRAYTYDDVEGDVELKHFALAAEDINCKIPLLKMACDMNKDLSLFSAAWTAPPWMKTNDTFNGYGSLKEENYQPYANYLLRFIEAYKEHGLHIKAMSTGNEPASNDIPWVKINSMGWDTSSMAEFIKNYLGPTLANSGIGTVIWILDDQRAYLQCVAEKLLSDEDVRKHVAGIAVHWYLDYLIPPTFMDEIHDRYPDKYMIMTEACTGSYPWDSEKVILGSWTRGLEYMQNILENLRHWVTGWVDWNLALDEEGGPTWAKNFVDSPIIVNATSDEFYKEPMFYAVAHYSRFVPVNSDRISTTDSADIRTIGFVTPNNQIVLVLCNTGAEDKTVMINDVKRGYITLELPASSMHTVIYRE